MQAQGIFISYRRTDTRADAGRLYDRLVAHFSNNRVFMDIDDIQPGQNFKNILQDTLHSCQVLLVLIGPSWLDAEDEQGARRLENAEDFVCQEIHTALERKIPVLPVLFNRAAMPQGDELPVGMNALADHQAVEISDTRFHEDVSELIAALERLMDVRRTFRPRPYYRYAAFISAALMLALGTFWLVSGTWLPVQTTADQAAAAAKTSALRHSPTQLSQAEFLRMLLAHNFYDADGNPQGGGAGNQYRLVMSAGDAVVIDHGTDLMWQQSSGALQQTFAAAKMAIQALNRQSFAGFQDWRLPTIVEAMSLLTPDVQAGIHMSPLFSPQKMPILWTADRVNNKSVWVVYCYAGSGGWESDQFNAWTRAVRTAMQ